MCSFSNLTIFELKIYFKLGGADNYLRELMHLYHGKAYCFENINRLEDAAQTHEEIAKLKFLDSDAEGQAEELRSAGRAWYKIDQWQKCLDSHKAAREIIDPSITTQTMGVDLLNIGMAQIKLGNYAEALENCLRARALCKEAKNPEFVGWCDNYLALTYIALSNGPEARFYAQHYFNYSKVTEDLGREAYACYRLGAALFLCGEYQDAEKNFNRSLELLNLEDYKDWEDIVGVNKCLAETLFALNRAAEAQARLERIKTIEETIAA